MSKGPQFYQNFLEIAAFPWLSVIPVIASVASVCLGRKGAKARMPNRVPNNSRAEILRCGSSRAKAQGALTLSNTKEIQGGSSASCLWIGCQAPITTSSLSALAMVRKPLHRKFGAFAAAPEVWR